MDAQYNISIAQDMGRSIPSETYGLMLYFVIEEKTSPSVGLPPPKQVYSESSHDYKANTISNPQRSIIRQQRSCNPPWKIPWCHLLGDTTS